MFLSSSLFGQARQMWQGIKMLQVLRWRDYSNELQNIKYI